MTLSPSQPGSRSWKVVQDAWRDVGFGSADPGTGLQTNAADYDVVMALLLSEHFRSRVYEVSTADITTHSAQEQKARLIEK
ncbi:hypothetical protein Tdes44962_MAKER00870 [Teratosphaeria destructans]|uniref:Uncharacterized protein n=1 Tax=Teratosphaeria destructans TaxID=418781 RepID=A0A9W7SLA4_9PEZI|nr:hypothetical protein Tdes44962_MAKER00870 [Teratosphaeria destructans]